MFSHINIGVSDFDRAFAFYRAVLEPLGLEVKYVQSEEGWAAWKHPDHDRPTLIIGTPLDERPHSVGNGSMVAFLAQNRAAVSDCHRIAMENGATDEGAPGPRAQYHPNYFGAYFRDIDGNKICVCCHSA